MWKKEEQGREEDCKSLLVLTCRREFKQLIKYVRKYISSSGKEKKVCQTWLFLTSHRQ